MSQEGDRRAVPDRREESIAVQIGHLEDVVNGAAEDIRDVRLAATEGLRRLDSRLHQLEDVRVRALEDWRLSQSVLRSERERVASEGQHRTLARWELWVAIVVGAALTAATILSALIATHTI